MSSWPWHVLGDRIGLLVPTAMGNTHPKCEQHLLVAGRRKAPYPSIILTFALANIFIHVIVAASDSFVDRRISFFGLLA